MKAKYIKSHEGWAGDARLYRMLPPYGGNEFVVISKVYAMFSGPETYIFPAKENGDVTDWGELKGSQRGEISHEDVLSEIGYTVE